jgi:hypothetical protein
MGGGGEGYLQKQLTKGKLQYKNESECKLLRNILKSRKNNKWACKRKFSRKNKTSHKNPLIVAYTCAN